VQLGNIVVGLLFPSGCFAFKAAHTYLFLSYYTNLNILNEIRPVSWAAKGDRARFSCFLVGQLS